jgi:hypothetical protein
MVTVGDATTTVAFHVSGGGDTKPLLAAPLSVNDTVKAPPCEGGVMPTVARDEALNDDRSMWRVDEGEEATRLAPWTGLPIALNDATDRAARSDCSAKVPLLLTAMSMAICPPTGCVTEMLHVTCAPAGMGAPDSAAASHATSTTPGAACTTTTLSTEQVAGVDAVHTVQLNIHAPGGTA